MIYGYEQPVQYNPVDVFNPVTANMVLQSMGQYADVLQREHERALQEEKEFLKEYGDFSSPVKGATEAYYNLGVGNVKKALDIAYANGVDLTRSQEGRAVLNRIINSAKVGKMNELKQQKAAYEQFQKSANEALQKGDATPEYIDALIKQHGLDNFTAMTGNEVNPWTLTSIPKYEGLDEFSDRIFDPIKNTYLETEGAFDYTGVGTKQMQSALAVNLPNYLNTPSGRYEMQNFLNSLPNGGADLTSEQKIKKFSDDIISRATDRYTHSTRELNPIWEMDEKQRLQKEMYDYRGTGGGSYGGGSGNSRGDGSGDNVEYGQNLQQEYFNRGYAKLLNVRVSTIDVPRANALSTARANQALIAKNRYADGKHDINGILNDLSIPYNPDEVARILNLKQVKEDSTAGVYSIHTNDLKHAYAMNEIFDNMDVPRGNGSDNTGKSKSEQIRKLAAKADIVKVTPTGNVVTYLRKDGTLKMMAKVRLNLRTNKGTKESPVYDDKVVIVYMDMGTHSRKLTNDPNTPVAIDVDRSTIRKANWNKATKEYTKPIYTDFGVQHQAPDEEETE